MTVAPPLATASISLPRREKSAESIEGAISTMRINRRKPGFGKHARARTSYCGEGLLTGDGRGCGGRRLVLTARFTLAPVFALAAGGRLFMFRVGFAFVFAGALTFRFAFAFALALARLLFAFPFTLAFAFLFVFAFF